MIQHRELQEDDPYQLGARWTQQDPVTGNIADPMSVDRYIYTGDDPVNVTDSSGMDPGELDVCLGHFALSIIGGSIGVVVP